MAVPFLSPEPYGEVPGFRHALLRAERPKLYRALVWGRRIYNATVSLVLLIWLGIWAQVAWVVLRG